MIPTPYSLANLEATAFKKSGDLNAAVASLKRAKSLCGDVYADTRLAKYLQLAGFFDEAMLEIQWLVDHSHSWAKSLFGHQPVSVIQCQRASWCSRIHAAAVLICKKAKRPDLQAEHQQLKERYADISHRLRSVSEVDLKAKYSAWDEAKAKGPEAMKAYLKKSRSKL